MLFIDNLEITLKFRHTVASHHMVRGWQEII